MRRTCVVPGSSLRAFPRPSHIHCQSMAACCVGAEYEANLQMIRQAREMTAMMVDLLKGS